MKRVVIVVAAAFALIGLLFFGLVIIGMMVAFMMAYRVQVVNTTDQVLEVGIVVDVRDSEPSDDAISSKRIRPGAARIYSIPFDMGILDPAIFFVESGSRRTYYCHRGVLDASEMIDQYYWRDMRIVPGEQGVQQALKHCSVDVE